MKWILITVFRLLFNKILLNLWGFSWQINKMPEFKEKFAWKIIRQYIQKNDKVFIIFNNNLLTKTITFDIIKKVELHKF